MGRFRNLFRPNIIGSAWANTLSSDELAQCLDSHKKREICNSFTSDECILMGEATSNSLSSSNPTFGKHSKDDISAPPQESQLKLLKRQLKQRDTIIAQLRQTMEASDKAQSERIYLLERQLERLIELSSSDCAALNCRTSSLSRNLTKTIKCRHIAKGDDPNHQCTQGHQKAKIEISVLEGLLARVVAEKDRLSFKNENLKSILLDQHDKAYCPSTSSESSTIPSSIKELDSVIRRNEHKTTCQGETRNCHHDHNLNSDNEWRRKSVPKKNESSPPASPEEQQTLLYQISCRKCPTDRPPVKYRGSFSATPNNTTQELTAIAMRHFSELCEIVQQQRDHKSDEWNAEKRNGSDSGSFRSSSLARHLVMMHCQRCMNEDNFFQWCIENIKVEIQKKRVVMNGGND